MASDVEMGATIDISPDEEGQIQEDHLPRTADLSPEPNQLDVPFSAIEFVPELESTAAKAEQCKALEAAPVPGFAFVKHEPDGSALSTLLSKYESSSPVEPDSMPTREPDLLVSTELSTQVEPQPTFIQDAAPATNSVTDDSSSSQSRPVKFSLSKKTVVKVEEQLPSFTNWKRRHSEAQYSRPPTRAVREARPVTWTPPPTADRPPVMPKSDYHPARGPPSHYSPSPRESARTTETGDYHRPQFSVASESRSSPAPEAGQRSGYIDEAFIPQGAFQTKQEVDQNLFQHRPGSYSMLPKFSKERKGWAECELQKVIPDEYRMLLGTNMSSLWIGVVRYKKYLIGNTYTQFDKYFTADYRKFGVASIGKRIRDALTGQIPVGQNVWLSSDQRIGVMVEQQLRQIQELERGVLGIDFSERPSKRRRHENLIIPATATSAPVLRGNAAVFQPSDAILTKCELQAIDVQTALSSVKEQVARIAQVKDWDNPHAAAVWGQVISEDLQKATESLQAALKKNGSS